MKFIKYMILSFSILFFSCEKQSNPYIPSSSENYHSNILMNGKVRDFILLKNVNAENFYSDSFGFQNNIMIPCSNENDSDSCDDRFWCSWDEISSICEIDERDILLVANELDGLLIYEINSEEGLDFSLIYSNNGFEYTDDPVENILDLELRSIQYSETNFTLYVLDKFEFIYQIFLPGILVEDQYKQYCNNGDQQSIHSLDIGDLGTYHATKFIINENNDILEGLFVLNKHNANNELYLDESYSEIQFASYDFFQPSGTSCDGIGAPITQTISLLSETDGLDYGIADIAFNGNSFIVANPTDEYFSFKVYDYSNSSTLSEISETLTSGKVTSTLLVNDYLYTSVKGAGCYITLLPAPGNFDEINNILNMPENFSVYNIQYDEFDGKESLLLSCGSNGVLVYQDINNDGLLTDENFVGHIMSSYAYVAKLFDSETVLVGTKNGIEIYNIGE